MHVGYSSPGACGHFQSYGAPMGVRSSLLTATGQPKRQGMPRWQDAVQSLLRIGLGRFHEELTGKTQYSHGPIQYTIQVFLYVRLSENQDSIMPGFLVCCLFRWSGLDRQVELWQNKWMLGLNSFCKEQQSPPSYWHSGMLALSSQKLSPRSSWNRHVVLFRSKSTKYKLIAGC